jgi:hypothetical protein
VGPKGRPLALASSAQPPSPDEPPESDALPSAELPPSDDGGVPEGEPSPWFGKGSPLFELEQASSAAVSVARKERRETMGDACIVAAPCHLHSGGRPHDGSASRAPQRKNHSKRSPVLPSRPTARGRWRGDSRHIARGIRGLAISACNYCVRRRHLPCTKLSHTHRLPLRGRRNRGGTSIRN